MNGVEVLEPMLSRLKLTAIRDQLDTLLVVKYYLLCLVSNTSRTFCANSSIVKGF